jgi:hypothetical protein
LDSAAGDGIIAQPAAAATADAAPHAHSSDGADVVVAPQQLPHHAVVEGAAAVTAAAAAALDARTFGQSVEQQQQQQQPQVPAKFTSTLSSVFEQGAEDPDWTPFATSNSAAVLADTTPRNSFSSECCQSPTSAKTAAASAAASHGSGHSSRHSKGSNGLKSAAVSAPVQCTEAGRSSSQTAGTGDTSQARDQGSAPLAAVRAASAQPPSHVQMSLAHLPQLAPRTR